MSEYAEAHLKYIQYMQHEEQAKGAGSEQVRAVFSSLYLLCQWEELFGHG